MQKKNLLFGPAMCLGLSVAAFSSGSWAAAISGETNVVCAALDVVSCAEGSCMQGQAHTFDLPTFLFVDKDRKVIHAKNSKGKEVASPIDNYEITDEAVILQGFENHRGWTVGIDRKSGKMSMSSTGADVSFIVFGDCTEN